MANLEQKTTMSPLQLSIALVDICIGISMITTTSELVAEAKESTWMSIILGGIIWSSIALLIIKLGRFFPQDTLVEYMPRLWGPVLGRLIIWLFNSIMCLLFSLAMAGFSRTITFFLFDRTPAEVVALGMLVICAYAALQDFGTILRLMEILFFTITPLFIITWLTSLINFQPDNLLPLWPENLSAVALTSIDTWPIFNGYEFILLLLPLVYTKHGKISLAVVSSFGCMTLIYTLLVLIAIGVLSAEAIINTPYPLLEVIRGVQIPGTFVERLEGYFLLFWIPITIDSYLFTLWAVAQIMMRQFQYSDHRPWVLILAPLLYTISILLDSLDTIKIISKLATWLGLFFSFVIIPISLLLAWRQQRRNICKNTIAGN